MPDTLPKPAFMRVSLLCLCGSMAMVFSYIRPIRNVGAQKSLNKLLLRALGDFIRVRERAIIRLLARS